MRKIETTTQKSIEVAQGRTDSASPESLTLLHSDGSSPTSQPKPLLRWAGSKRQLLPILRRLMPSYSGRYVEPFAGSAALFFHSCPSQAVLGDLNSDLIDFYRVVQSRAGAVYAVASSFARTAEQYYKLRSESTPADDIDRAARFFFLNRLCFNGIYRTNSKGKFNVPFGSSKVGRFPTPEAFESASDALASTALLNQDFETTLLRANRGDFCYIDPPYYSDSSRVFAEYDHRPFSRTDVLRLRNVMLTLDSKGVSFMVSYQQGEEATTLAEGFTIDYVIARRTIAGATERRKAVRELIIRNYN